MFVSGAGPISNLLSVASAGYSVAYCMRICSKNSNHQKLQWQREFHLLFCYVFGIGILVNLMLAVFNMLPIHPLDGSGVLEGLLPQSWSEAYQKMRPYGFIILLVFFYLPAFSRVILTVVAFIAGLFQIRFFSLQRNLVKWNQHTRLSNLIVFQGPLDLLAVFNSTKTKSIFMTSRLQLLPNNILIIWN